jgi:5-methylcytosine-specific restriction endonuclease McrA
MTRYERRCFIWAEQLGCCAYCNNKINIEDATLDHLRPKAKGGLTELANLVIACGRCNTLKGDLDLYRFLRRHRASIPILPSKVFRILDENQIIALFRRRLETLCPLQSDS